MNSPHVPTPRLSKPLDAPGRLVAFLALVFAAASMAPTTASASHYPLNAIDIASSDETYALYKAGVTDTKTLLEGAGRASARKALASKTKLPVKRLKALASLCDLLQVRGIGPTVARLLQRCDIPNLKAFKAKKLSEAAALSACMSKKNREDPISELVPGADFIEGWIKAAGALESRVD